MNTSEKGFFAEHSLSIVLLAGFLGFSLLAMPFAESMGKWMYDWSLMVGGCLGGGAAIVIAAKWFWEPGSDPAKPPEKK